MSEDDKDKDVPKDVVGWRPSPEAKELLSKVTGEARKKLLNKLVEDEAKRQREISASPCEQRTLDWIDTLKTHYVPYYEKKLKEDERNRGYTEHADDHIAYDKREINWAKWWLNHYRTKFICGTKRGHAPEDQGDFKVRPEWVVASKSYDPEAKLARR